MKETRERKVFTMDTIIKCEICKKKIRYGDSFSSLELQGKNGGSKNICEECSKKECKRMEEGTIKWAKSIAKRR